MFSVASNNRAGEFLKCVNPVMYVSVVFCSDRPYLVASVSTEDNDVRNPKSVPNMIRV